MEPKKKSFGKSEFWLRGKNSEMKFRVWSNVLHQFVDIAHSSETMDLACKDGIWFMGDEARVIQPYIGCKDIDGVEIYEGDIVETDESWTAVVVFGDGMFCCEDAGGGFSSYVNWGACKVIGNVYENPELVKELRKDAKKYKELAKALREEKKK